MEDKLVCIVGVLSKYTPVNNIIIFNVEDSNGIIDGLDKGKDLSP
jgi:hypothetical protein